MTQMLEAIRKSTVCQALRDRRLMGFLEYRAGKICVFGYESIVCDVRNFREGIYQVFIKVRFNVKIE